MGSVTRINPTAKPGLRKGALARKLDEAEDKNRKLVRRLVDLTRIIKACVQNYGDESGVINIPISQVNMMPVDDLAISVLGGDKPGGMVLLSVVPQEQIPEPTEEQINEMQEKYGIDPDGC